MSVEAECVRWSDNGEVIQCVDGTSVPSVRKIHASSWVDDMREWPKVTEWVICHYFMHSMDIDGAPMQNMKGLESYKLFFARKVDKILHYRVNKELIFLKAEVCLCFL